MAYCTKDDLNKKVTSAKVSSLASDPDVTTDGWEDVVIDDTIKCAEAIVNSAFDRLYPVPFVVVPRVVQDLTAEVALNKLFKRSREQNLTSPGEDERLPFGDVYAELEKYRTGEKRIPAEAIKSSISAGIVNKRDEHLVGGY